MKKAFLAALSAVVLLPLITAAPAHAQRHRDHDWRDRDIHQFHERDFGRWRGGNWWHGRWGGRDGWWWVVGGVRYWYPAPVYPYPDPYAPPAPVAALPPPPTTYYYCDNPQGYYPYVPQCTLPWRAVPAN